MTTERELRESPSVEPALSVDSALLEPVACDELPRWDHDDFHGAAEEPWASFCRFFLRCFSEAVPAYIPLGVPLWLDIDGPLGKPRTQRLFCCHDVGGAIKGRLRGDINWGSGEQADHLAGATQSQGHTYLLYLLLPPLLPKARCSSLLGIQR
jgi:hypothetical protein